MHLLYLPQPTAVSQISFHGELQGASRPLDGHKYIFFLDESGGPFTADPVLRRAGWGISVLLADPPDLQSSLHVVGGISGSLPGAL